METEYCKVSPEKCANSRRCFMTGEHCSKQMNIQQERKKLHTKQNRKVKANQSVEYEDSYEINAFVVMNFSDMSNVVYKWRLRSFIESLKKYLYLNVETHEILCLADSKADIPEKEDKNKWKRVNQINVIRSDSNPASNYVICNRVCQQMQIADLVIVDVSVENTNVFYELGMAMAFGKLILPICYNESIFEHVLPVKKSEDGKNEKTVVVDVKKDDMENVYSKHKKADKSHWYSGTEGDTVKYEKHIDCFPWRRRLFEYYGIRFKNAQSTVQYGPFNKENERSMGVSNEKYRFSDMLYKRFPYNETIDHWKDEKRQSKKIGERIYNRLRESYNSASTKDNTLVVYTMDGFMNEDEAGRCMVNYYTYMTSQMKHMQCFQGDRVGILVQENIIKEDHKDSKSKKDLLYNIGNIIHIGMNQATYAAQKERIKTTDFLPDDTTEIEEVAGESEEEKRKRKEQMENLREEQIKFIKEHVGNRSVTILPDHPIYVKHVKDGIQEYILTAPEEQERYMSVENKEQLREDWKTLFDHYYCLYHMMLRTLSYTNEVVVDISNNSIQALFWLGAAHGSDAHAITVRYERSEKEKAEEEEKFGRPERPIFDVSGLWTAILRSHDTEGFYRELMQAQLSIEQHSKLVLEELDVFSEKILDYLNEASYRNRSDSSVQELVDDKKDKEARKLESFYRDYFWRRMLRYNKLHMYIAEYEKTPSDNRNLQTPLEKRDVNAVAEFSHYLSKRKVIGEYYIETLPEDGDEKKSKEIEMQNFVCIGGNVKPFAHGAEKCAFPDYIFEKTNPEKEVCKQAEPTEDASTQKSAVVVNTKEEGAKLFFWRKIPESSEESVKFQVALIGDDGDATRALSSILVDREQKIAMFGKNWDRKREPNKLFLNEIQRLIRETFTKRYTQKIGDKLSEDNYVETMLKDLPSEDAVKNKLLEEVKAEIITLIKLYLSTVLYRYFLPFLTWEDEHRICNGMEVFMIALRHDQKSRFKEENMKEFEKSVRKILAEVLREFRGVEANYVYTVSEKDEMDIQLKAEGEESGVVCLFKHEDKAT